MSRIARTLGFVALLVLLPALSRQAYAIPVLQLDMAGGVYDPVTQTIVAPGGAFTVYALLSPQIGATASQIQALRNTTYYLSVALTPQTTPGSYGSFAFGQAGTSPTTVDVTSDMYYGTPPVEAIGELLQPRDPGDLARHSIFPTYFSEFAFTFNPALTTARYNSQDDPGGPSAGTGAYYMAFNGDSSLLAAGYQLHFDLYDTTIRDCGRNTATCTDEDINRFAPFSHDAQTIPRESVPEPGSALLMLLGMVGAGGFAGRRGFSRGNTV